MVYEQEKCPVCGVQATADRVGQSWQVVGKLSANEKGQDVQDVPNTTPTSKKPMVLQSTITTNFYSPKGISVQYAGVELVNGILRLTTTIKMTESAGFSAPDAIRALLDSWIISELLDEQYVT